MRIVALMKSIDCNVQDGFYNIVPPSVPLYPDSEGPQCNKCLSGAGARAAVVASDSLSGTEQFLFQLAQAPNHYHITIPRSSTFQLPVAFADFDGTLQKLGR